ncbi:hypothetical protein FE392_10530 [Xenorhabdus sp. 12]|uniref:Uncharacterized protein n=1 Tax=Xenorhabdus santafensis TaxID=2582833 RepID=A0ABU4SAJ1_9GAMM|nr:hypothetical protein [Xenorhabdus sp. 12]MDX7987761.1 hypothetical protein [Xenorhabdus sp. 12]
MPWVNKYIENKTEYAMFVNVKDTNSKSLLNQTLAAGEVKEFQLYFSDSKYDYCHMTKLYVELSIDEDIFSSLFSAYEVDTGLDVYFNTYPKISVNFDLKRCSFSLEAGNH